MTKLLVFLFSTILLFDIAFSISACTDRRYYPVTGPESVDTLYLDGRDTVFIALYDTVYVTTPIQPPEHCDTVYVFSPLPDKIRECLLQNPSNPIHFRQCVLEALNEES